MLARALVRSARRGGGAAGHSPVRFGDPCSIPEAAAPVRSRTERGRIICKFLLPPSKPIANGHPAAQPAAKPCPPSGPLDSRKHPSGHLARFGAAFRKVLRRQHLRRRRDHPRDRRALALVLPLAVSGRGNVGTGDHNRDEPVLLVPDTGSDPSGPRTSGPELRRPRPSLFPAKAAMRSVHYTRALSALETMVYRKIPENPRCVLYTLNVCDAPAAVFVSRILRVLERVS